MLNLVLEMAEVSLEPVSPGCFLTSHITAGTVLSALFFPRPLAARHSCKALRQAEGSERTPELHLAA